MPVDKWNNDNSEWADDNPKWADDAWEQNASKGKDPEDVEIVRGDRRIAQGDLNVVGSRVHFPDGGSINGQEVPPGHTETTNASSGRDHLGSAATRATQEKE